MTVSAPQLGKTLVLGLWALVGCWQDAAAKTGLPTWWAAPTYGVAEQGMRKLEELARGAGIFKSSTYSNKMQVRLLNGGVIDAKSWDVPENLYGPTVGRIAIDEFGFLTTEASVALKSRVAETRVLGSGYMRYVGNVGEVGGEAEAIWHHATSGAAGWSARTWTWRDRAEAAECACAGGEPIAVSLEPESVALHTELCERGLYLSNLLDSKKRMSDLHFRQLYGAEWLDWSALPAYTFDRAVHVTPEVKEEQSLPIDLACDFNVDPMIWIVGQHTARTAWALDEIVIPGGATTMTACKVFIEKWGGRRDRELIVYGDASGNARDTKSKRTDYQIIQAELGPHFPKMRMEVQKQNPPVTTRLNSVNALLKAGDGEVRYYLHPRCAKLANDWARVSLKPGTHEIDKTNKSLTHASDAEGYRLTRLFPVQGASTVVRGGQWRPRTSENPAWAGGN